MWQIYSNDSAVALGVSRWKTNPLSSDPSVTPAHYSALSIVFLSLSEISWQTRPLKNKMKRLPWSHSFPPPYQHLPSPPPPPPSLQWQTLCCTDCCHVDVSVIKQACDSSYCDIHVWHLKLFEELVLLESELSCRLSFMLLHALRQEAIWSLVRLWEVEQVATHSRSLSAHSYHLSISTWRYASVP